MTRGKELDIVADGKQALQLRGKVDSARGFARASNVECCDTNRISCSNYSVLHFVVKYPGEHAVQVSGRVDAVLLVKGNDDLAIGVCLEGIGLSEVLAEDLVVVDFSVDREGNLAIIAEEGLGSTVDTDDTQTLMDKDSGASYVVSTPIGATMPDAANCELEQFVSPSRETLTPCPCAGRWA